MRFDVVADRDRGDCNNDGEIDAADFSATQLEIFDANDGHIEWWLIYLGDFNGSPIGCDSNRSKNGFGPVLKRSVDAADLTCTVNLFFGEECLPIMAAADTQAAVVSVGSGLQMGAGGKVTAPIVLDTAGQNVAAAAFNLKYDPALFSIDTADANGDGIPDAITFSVPNSVVKAVVVDNEAGLAKFALFGVTLPLPLFQDGPIANVTLTGKVSAAGQSAVELKQVSIGDNQGRSVPVDEIGGVITFGAGSNLYLPMIQSH